MATVVVAVKNAEGKGSQRAVRWAVENLMHTADRLLLVRVMPTVACIPTPCTFASFLTLPATSLFSLSPCKR